MQNSEVAQLIQDLLPEGSRVEIGGDGHHFEAVIISSIFEGLSKIKRQQLIYKGLHGHITSGAIHALQLNTFTPEEWNTQHG